VTAHPTADWTGQQLREAFPFAQLPRYLLRDRDAIFGDDFREHVRDLGICEVLSAPRAPWQRAYIERVIGSVRRECLDHMIVFHETSLRRTLTSYFDLLSPIENASFASAGSKSGCRLVSGSFSTINAGGLGVKRAHASSRRPLHRGASANQCGRG